MAVSIDRVRSLRVCGHAGEQIAALGGIATPMMLAGTALATSSLSTWRGREAQALWAVLQAHRLRRRRPRLCYVHGSVCRWSLGWMGLKKLIPRWLMWLGMVVAVAGEAFCAYAP